MIVSFRHQFVFVAIPKTATHAVRAALRPSLADTDWEQCSRWERRSFPVAELAAVGHGHLTCREVRPFLVGDLWTRLSRFCVVRHPCSRFISSCRFMHRDTNMMRDDPEHAMARALDDASSLRHPLLRPQADFVTDGSGGLMVQTVLRYESLQDDFDDLCRRLRLPVRTLALVNASPRETSHITLTDALKERLCKRYATDFATFGYAVTP